MAGTATYRVTTTDHEQTHAYITDRRYLESQVDVNSIWGPVRGKFSRAQLAAMTALGADLSNDGIEYMNHMWTPEVLNSTDEEKEACPFVFLNFLLPATRQKNTLTTDNAQRPQGQADPRDPLSLPTVQW